MKSVNKDEQIIQPLIVKIAIPIVLLLIVVSTLLLLILMNL